MKDSLFLSTAPFSPHLSLPQTYTLVHPHHPPLSLSLSPFTQRFSENSSEKFFGGFQSVELKHMALVLPTYFVPKGRAPVHDNKGRTEGLKLGAELRGQILFSRTHAHQPTLN